MSRRREIACPREPIGLSAEEAAAYLSISVTTFLTAVEKGLLPQPHQLLSRMIWDAEELRAALRNLPRRGDLRKDSRDGIDWDDVAA